MMCLEKFYSDRIKRCAEGEEVWGLSYGSGLCLCVVMCVCSLVAVCGPLASGGGYPRRRRRMYAPS